MEVQQFKFCMNCGSRMPGTNKFCTNCGTKLSDRQPVAQPSNNVPNTVNNEKTAQYELTLGKSYLNGTSVQKNYEQAALHLKKATALGSSEAPVLLAVAYLYQGIDILRYTQYLPAADKVSFQNRIPGTHATANNNEIKNNAGNSGGSKLTTAGKYAAAAATGALASTLLHNNAAAGNKTYQTPSDGPGEQSRQTPLYDNPVQENNDETYNNEVPAEGNNINEQQDDYTGEENGYDNAGDNADSADASDSSYFDNNDGDLF